MAGKSRIVLKKYPHTLTRGIIHRAYGVSPLREQGLHRNLTFPFVTYSLWFWETVVTQKLVSPTIHRTTVVIRHHHCCLGNAPLISHCNNSCCSHVIIFCCISFACHDFLMSVTHQHHHSLDILYSDCPTGDTKTICIWMDLYGNWGVGLDSSVNYGDTVWNTLVG